MKRYSTILSLVIVLTACSVVSAQWTRNTFPSMAQHDAGFAEGQGWDHVQAIYKVAVSPLDPNLMILLDNVNAAVISEDGEHFVPLNMEYINTFSLNAMDVEFSRHDANTFYLLVSADYWDRVDFSNWPVGVWRTTDRGQNWEHIYKLSEGQYEFFGNLAGKSKIQEDPHDHNHLYFGTTSSGIMHSKDGGVTWSSLAPNLADRNIKTLIAGKRDTTKTVLYAIVEKKMPQHINGERVPMDIKNVSPEDYVEHWDFENNLNGANGDTLSGSVGFSDYCSQGMRSATFNGSSQALESNVVLNSSHSSVAASAWVRTTAGRKQVIVSFGKFQYFELGIKGTVGESGQAYWSVTDSDGVLHEIASSTTIHDGDWHHVLGAWNDGEIAIYVDGVREFRDTGASLCGTGLTRNGRIGYNGTGQYFEGQLDGIHVFDSEKPIHEKEMQEIYLEYEHKGPFSQGALWRFDMDANGDLETATRLGGNINNFVKLDIDASDASKGWVIRQGMMQTWPFGGREVESFTDFGATFTPQLDKNDLGKSKAYHHILVNPSNGDHVVLQAGGDVESSLRYTLNANDSTVTWQGVDRTVTPEGYVPDFKSLMARDWVDGHLGLGDDSNSIQKGETVAFIPGTDDVLYFLPTSGGLMKSTDGGATFETGFSGGLNKESLQLAVAPSDPNAMAIGMLEYGMVNTRNGGRYWTGIWDGNDATFSALTQAADDMGAHWGEARVAYGTAYNPTDSSEMISLYTEQGYIVRSTDGGLTWSNTNYKQPDGTKLERGLVLWGQSNADVVYAGRMKSVDGGTTWSDMGKYIMAMSASNHNLIVAMDIKTSNVRTTSLNLHVSTDGGASWEPLPDPNRETVPGTTMQWLPTTTRRYPSHHAHNLIAIDPSPSNDPTVDSSNRLRLLLAGRSGIYEYNAVDSGGGGGLWNIRNSGLLPSEHFDEIEDAYWMAFVAIDPRPGYENIVYAASAIDKLNLSWWNEDDNPNHVYPGGLRQEPLYQSDDGGVTWTPMDIPDDPNAPRGVSVKDLLVDSSGVLRVATAHGIYSYGIVPNTPPVWDEDPFTAPDAQAGVAYDKNHKWRVTDAEGDPLTFTKVAGPAWMSINSNGKATGTPSASDPEIDAAIISVSDGVNPPVLATMYITVIGGSPNLPPVWDEDPFTAPNAQVGVAYSKNNKWRVTDAEDDDLSFTKVSGPAWVSISESGKATGTPTAAGTDEIVISVSDGFNNPVEATMFITVD